MARSRFADTLAAAMAHFRGGDGSYRPEDLTHLSQLIGRGIVGRGDFDDAVVSLLESVGVEPEGVRSWLSDIDDEEIVEAFARVGRRRPSERDISALGRGTFRRPNGDGAAFAATLSGISGAERPAILGTAYLGVIGRALGENPRTTVICDDPSGRAAVALWLHLEGIRAGDSIAPVGEALGYDRLLCLDPVDDAPGLAERLLAPGGEAVFLIDRGEFSGRVGKVGRESAVRSGLLDGSVDVSRFSGVWRFVKGRVADAPVYLAKTWGRGAEASFGDASGTPVAADMAEAILRHEQIDHFGMDVPVETILGQPRASLRLDDYATTVPRPAPRSSGRSIPARLTWYEGHLDDDGDARRMVLDAAQRILEADETSPGQ